MVFEGKPPVSVVAATAVGTGSIDRPFMVGSRPSSPRALLCRPPPWSLRSSMHVAKGERQICESLGMTPLSPAVPTPIVHLLASLLRHRSLAPTLADQFTYPKPRSRPSFGSFRTPYISYRGSADLVWAWMTKRRQHTPREKAMEKA